MNRVQMIACVTALCVCLGAGFAVAQTSNGTGGGNWSSTSTWVGGVVPTGAGTITIAATDSVFFDVPVTITGTLINQSRGASRVTTGSLTFGNGGMYVHAAVNRGSIPLATWGIGSTCLVSGVRDTVPANTNQNFYNFSWSGKNQTGNVNLGWNSSTVIAGNLDVTGLLARALRLTTDAFGATATSPTVITINGNVTEHDTAYLTASGSSNFQHWVRVVVGGDLTVSGGTGTATQTMFQLANSSTCYASWWVKGMVTFANCTTATNNTNPDTLVFAGNNIQTLTNSGIELNNANIVIYPGAKVAMGPASTLGTLAKSFTMADGATFLCGSATGLAGNITITATKTFGTACNFVFNGSAAQVTSALMPATVNNVTINNAAGVTSSQSLTIDTLFLITGTLSGPFTATVTTAGTSVKQLGTGIPEAFSVNQNYPNPFNPSTKIAFGLPHSGYVTVQVYSLLGQQVATVFAGYLAAGNKEVDFNASNLSSGVYLYRVQAGNSVAVKKMVLMK